MRILLKYSFRTPSSGFEGFAISLIGKDKLNDFDHQDDGYEASAEPENYLFNVEKV